MSFQTNKNVKDAVKIVTAIVAQALSIKPDDISEDALFSNLGVDPVMASKISKDITVSIGSPITPIDMYEANSIRALAMKACGLDISESPIWKEVPESKGESRSNEMSRNLREPERTDATVDDPIVVAGMSARFPNSPDIESYWQNLLGAENLVNSVDRWNEGLDNYKGGLVSDYDCFDASFFRISPREAVLMDPQHRVLMEIVWHAIEDSGFTLSALRELSCGVFSATLPGDYKYKLFDFPEQGLTNHGFTGNAVSSASGRLSYFLDITGPSITLDTACSSSLSLLYQACLSIKEGDCGAAIVSAASVFSTPEVFQLARGSGLLSENGHCATFSSEADGFAPSEGCAAIIVTRQSTALEHGLHIYGAIESLSVNHNGTSNGLMSPSVDAQAALIERCYKKANTSPSELAYIEAHGTGTKIGDPMELNALHKAFNALGAEPEAFIGSSKAVIGHSLVCAGLAGLVKVVMANQKLTIPPHKIATSRNKDVDTRALKISSEPQTWPKGQNKASVSAFGFTGSNAHLILDFAKVSRPHTSVSQFEELLIFPFSANSTETLREVVLGVRDYVRGRTEICLSRISTILLRRPTVLRHRSVIIADSVDGLVQGMDRLLRKPGLKTVLIETGEDKKYSNLNDIAQKSENWLNDATLMDLSGYYNTTNTCASCHRDFPHYPFERQRHWIGNSPHPIETVGASAVEASSTLSISRSKQKIVDLNQINNRRNETNSLQKSSQSNAPGNSTSGMRWWKCGGEGRPILLMPPMNMDHRAWIQQRRYLHNKGYSIHSPIYPGHCGTDFDLDSFSYDHLIEDILEYVERISEGQKIPICGWSLGGLLAMSCAIQDARFIESLVLVSTAPNYEDSAFEAIVSLNGELADRRDYLSILFEAEELNIESLGAGAGLDVLQYYYGYLMTLDLGSTLDAIDIPVLVVSGEHDPVAGPEAVRQLSGIKGSEIFSIPEVGHFAPLLHPTLFNKRLGDFLYMHSSRSENITAIGGK
jgi:3-oxoacyl-(acyl-carrier-protein) synthase/pimeloyl-ACP methyl ester carboxylesterase